ncbi:MAG TPA: GNAT family N-acetyltransferase, partial [Roseiflexaceae bacterium]|nr:GNAT family N-acetyltransferase [Roseiflexaceae bacterium]
MEFRYQPITEADLDSYVRIEQQAYGSSPDEIRTWFREKLRDLPRGLFRDGQLVTQLVLYPVEVQTGYNSVPCGAIGSVATPPEDRRRGYTGRILRAMCDELRADRRYMCFLYPFKESFYGQYGWVTSSEVRAYRGEPARFASFRQDQGRFVACDADSFAEFDAVYRRALRGRFGPLVRSEHWWRDTVLSSTYRYLWRDDAGVARAYICYNRREEKDDRVMACREVVACDPVARGQ